MRTTVRIDDELLQRLKARAQRENVSLTRLLDHVLRTGLQPGGAHRRKRPVYREPPQSLGKPLVSLDKAIALAAALEDEEIVRKLALRK